MALLKKEINFFPLLPPPPSSTPPPPPCSPPPSVSVSLSLAFFLPPSLPRPECMAFLYEDLGFLWSSKSPCCPPPYSDRQACMQPGCGWVVLPCAHTHTHTHTHTYTRSDAAIMIAYKAVTRGKGGNATSEVDPGFMAESRGSKQSMHFLVRREGGQVEEKGWGGARFRLGRMAGVSHWVICHPCV